MASSLPLREEATGSNNHDTCPPPPPPPPHRRHHHHHRHFLICQVLSIIAYIASWVANAEMIQGITTGAIGPNAYQKPVFLTWLSYNAMMAGFILAIPWIRREYNNNNDIRNGTMTLWQFVTTTWRGTWRLSSMCTACLGLQILLTACHVAYVMGLGKISVATLNAVYQCQAVCTLAWTVTILGATFTRKQAVGIVLSMTGIAAIVIPPLYQQEQDNQASWSSSNWQDTLSGTLATVVSAALWGLYQVAWKALHISKLGGKTMTPTQELIDTLVTLAVIGVANLTVGWVLLPIADAIGFESLEWPAADMTAVLTVNAAVEYAFNALIAIAIHMTSPLATAVTAPLTIPVSWMADQVLYGIPMSSATGGATGWFGAALIVFGLYWMELQTTQEQGGGETDTTTTTTTQNSYAATLMNESHNLLPDRSTARGHCTTTAQPLSPPQTPFSTSSHGLSTEQEII